VHLVEEGLDSGPILAQSAVEVRDDDTLESLEQRVHEAEHHLYPWAVEHFLMGSWRRVGRRVTFETATAGRTP
jgi:phosphoribosylglycinamide formyltransferase-1